MYFQKSDKSAMVGPAPSWSGDRGESMSTQVRPCLGSCQRKLGIFRYLFCVALDSRYCHQMKLVPSALYKRFALPVYILAAGAPCPGVRHVGPASVAGPGTMFSRPY